MSFTWKDRKDIWKGEGIYHLTFVVEGRRPLLGKLVAEYPDVTRPFFMNLTKRVPAVNELGQLAMVQLSPLGQAISQDLNAFELRHPGIKICRKMILDDHLHVVLWVQEPGKRSILEIAHGFRIGITKIAKNLGVWPPSDLNGLGLVDNGKACDASESTPYHLLSKPYVRTLSQKGQLDHMCEYVVLNAYRKYMKRQHPDLFTMHKDYEVKGLHFRSMGNHWLLDWPERVLVECSRDITEDELAKYEAYIMKRAETGAVVYSAAISKGEQSIMRHVREKGWPIVILLKASPLTPPLKASPLAPPLKGRGRVLRPLLLGRGWG